MHILTAQTLQQSELYKLNAISFEDCWFPYQMIVSKVQQLLQSTANQDNPLAIFLDLRKQIVDIQIGVVDNSESIVC